MPENMTRSILEPIHKPLLPVLFMVDTSGSMAGERIDCVNEALHEFISCTHWQKADYPYDLKVALIRFDTQAEIMTEDFPSVFDFPVLPPLGVGGMTNLADALRRADELLAHLPYHRPNPRIMKPLIILITDGYPTSPWEGKLQLLEQCNRFWAHSCKYAVILGYDLDRDLAVRITHREDAVYMIGDDRMYPNVLTELFCSTIMGDYLVQDG